MRPLQLDFQRAYRPVPWLGLCVLLAALVALAGMVGYYQRLNRQIDTSQRSIDTISRRAGQLAPASRAVTEQKLRAQMLEIKHANQVVRELALPWNGLLKAVESAGSQNIALLSLEPDLQKGTVKIGGEAKDFDALLKYVKDLSTREVFGSVLLQNHQIQQGIPEKPVRFTLVAQWKGVAP